MDERINYLLNQIMDLALKHGNEAECFYTNVESNSFTIKDNAIESRKLSNTRGIGLRLLCDGKLGHAHTTDFSESGLNELLSNVLLNLKYQEKAYPIGFINEVILHEEANVDSKLINQTFNEKQGLLKTLESKIPLNDKIRKIEQSSYSEYRYESQLVNSNGFSMHTNGNFVNLGIMLLSEFNGQEESGSAGMSIKSFDRLSLDKIAEEAIFDATKLLGAEKLSSYNGMAILSKDMSKILLSLIGNSFKGDNLYKKKALFDTLGEKIAPEFFNLVDNPLLKNGLGSYSRDSEGTLAEKTVLVENGVVKNHLYDRYYAQLMNMKSTGNASRDGYSDIPYVSFSNYYLENGSYSLDELLAIMKNGVYITDILGAHTANPITGDFSFGISGIMVKDGVFAMPFRGATLSGNLKSVLKNIVALGNDGDFYESVSAPSILIDSVSIAG